jgi:hypothetical protein
MSSHSDTQPCRNKLCTGNMDTLDDNEGHHEWCSHCGHTQSPTNSQCDLAELNERREQYYTYDDVGEDGGFGSVLEPLDTLPGYELRAL